MKFVKLYILTLLCSLLAFPAIAQDETENDSIVVDNDSIFADSLRVDSIPFPQRMVQTIDNLLQSSMFETSQVGMMIYDLDADSVLYKFNERQLLRPASTMKLLTAITALDRLGTKYSYTTSLYCTGECDSIALNGDIYVHGGMDPSFDSYDMDCLVEAVAKLHVDTIRGSLIADRSFKDTKLLGEGWCWDDKNPPLTPLLYKRKDAFIDELHKRLTNQGIIILGNDSIANVPKKAKLLTERHASLEMILTKMMKESDNLYAESMLYQIAASKGRPATAKSAQFIEKQIIKRAGLDPDRYRLADGSGLSLYNYLSAECETKLLRYAYKDKKLFGALCQSLPAAGVDGTLKSRMRYAPVQDNVRAKTGTLSGISSLAGYCTAPNGHMLAFSIINQGIMHASNAKTFQNRVCTAMCK